MRARAHNSEEQTSVSIKTMAQILPLVAGGNQRKKRENFDADTSMKARRF